MTRGDCWATTGIGGHHSWEHRCATAGTKFIVGTHCCSTMTTDDSLNNGLRNMAWRSRLWCKFLERSHLSDLITTIIRSKRVRWTRHVARIENMISACKITVLVFWVVTPCELAGRYQRFGGTYCLHLHHRENLKYKLLVKCLSGTLKGGDNFGS
jgi:hypothetical protein